MLTWNILKYNSLGIPFFMKVFNNYIINVRKMNLSATLTKNLYKKVLLLKQFIA